MTPCILVMFINILDECTASSFRVEKWYRYKKGEGQFFYSLLALLYHQVVNLSRYFSHLCTQAYGPYKDIRFFHLSPYAHLFNSCTYYGHPSYICTTFPMLNLLCYPEERGGSVFWITGKCYQSTWHYNPGARSLQYVRMIPNKIIIYYSCFLYNIFSKHFRS